MKLHTKLILFILLGSLVVVSGSQYLEYHSVVNRIADLENKNLLGLSMEQEKSTKNICESVEFGIKGSLKRGEMEKFAALLREQKSIRGLEECSLVDKKGRIANSSTESRVGNTMSSAEFAELQNKPQNSITRVNSGTIEIFNPQTVSQECLRCHQDWPIGTLGGVTYYRFSREAYLEAEKEASQTLASTQALLLSNIFKTLFGIVAVLVATTFLLLKVYVANPLGLFVGLLDRFEKDEGDLTRRIEIQTSDEIGILARLFNSFVGKLNTVVAGAQQTAQTVGEAASNQAVMVEKTSADLETVAQGSQKNAGNANQTNALMGEISGTITEAHNSMTGLTTSMNELASRSKEVASIIMTIDQIAFQTNLLALNAAVEAARAGSAGAGFAVVADEVRNLALKSAAASKNIGELISQTVEKISQSQQLVGSTAQVFDRIRSRTESARTLMDDIVNLTKDQSKRIDAISKELSEMRERSHENAAEAEELSQTMSVFKTDFNSKK
ncbi:MAG: methyl-accepting chemotaxis protein [Candidatus Riflebacteria bacterium]|nr:methyl-accepting chemotaxis protein [Candidatus Riflebacteria bacterium]